MESSIKVLENRLILTAGPSAEEVESSIKVLEDHLG